MKMLLQQMLFAVVLIFGSATVAAAQANLPDIGAPVAGQKEAMPAQNKTLERDKLCTRCHDEYDGNVWTIYQTPHGVRGDARTPACQSCHGESVAHRENKNGTRPKPDVLFSGKSHSSADAQNGQCLQCHQGGLRLHWSGSQHQMEGLACSNCHKVHAPRDPVLSKQTQENVCFTCHKTQRAETHLISTHPIAALKLGCSSCHNPHGSTGPKLLRMASVNETCYTCHAEKRGPFLWEHSPVVDDCTNCHTPHGSNNPPLLKARVPWLCQDCHSGDHANQANSGANLPNGNITTINGQQALGGINPRAQMNARACLNCHVLIHGSNNPAGTKFQR